MLKESIETIENLDQWIASVGILSEGEICVLSNGFYLQPLLDIAVIFMCVWWPLLYIYIK
jgi:hypothetical protein